MPPTPSKDYVLRVGCVHVSLDAQYRMRFFLRDESVKLPRDRKKKSSSHLGECSGQKVPSRAVSTFAAYSSDAGGHLATGSWRLGDRVVWRPRHCAVLVVLVARTVACLDALNLSYARQLKTEADDPNAFVRECDSWLAAPPSSSTYSHFCV